MFKGKKTLSVATLVMLLGMVEQSGIINIIPEHYKGATIAVIGAAMAVLRLVTKTPV